MINKRFLYYKKLDTFKNDLNEGIIDRESIGFIEDANLIWTHDVYFGSNGAVELNQITELENTLQNNYYNKTQSNNIFMTKDEFDEYLNPMQVSISIDPSNTVEYTGEDYPVTITYRVQRKNVLNTPDSVVVKLDNNIIYTGTDATKTISATVKTAIKHTASVSATKEGETINASASKYIVHPTYMFFDKSSSKEGVTLPSQKYLYTSLNASGIEINNNEDGNYLWIVTPYTLNKITTDAGRSYPVEMSDEGVIGNHKYYRSVLQVDKSNIRYWIN